MLTTRMPNAYDPHARCLGDICKEAGKRGVSSPRITDEQSNEAQKVKLVKGVKNIQKKYSEE
ncbi:MULTISPECIES: hypothetical protein [Bacteroides]|uniref:Uncharacterized protein n=1 Tax=Bacteroides salyersiae TaxID=291644 RepID=A0A7J4XH27_9BACE|nr:MULTISPECIES: hypothetical protein [Bacteroides]KAA3692050.1 hypothetical protein F3F90_11075 [Bacteroides salyersiae]KAA3697134.1 hypothetical protein F3F89_09920 [Bacteroides salyersiae]KAA3698682.1 hypothetical protein F3F88_11075 [Bacteroides salyersiae]KAA3705126.1 hypothetical protein F3F83_14220 [Bacteroides salyersiae]KAA3710468.1 hypothetical protein F3G09_11100 [Bacteroides salyersiae]